MTILPPTAGAAPRSPHWPRLTVALVGLGLSLSSQSFAQEPAAAPAPPAPAVQAPAEPAAAAAAEAAPAEAIAANASTSPPLACVPGCRDGFTCHEGQCISACNPACPDDTVCSSNAQCVLSPAAQEREKQRAEKISRHEQRHAAKLEQHKKRHAAKLAWHAGKRERHAAARAAKKQRRAKRHAKWLKTRHKPRPTIGVRGGLYRLEKNVLSADTYGQFAGLELGKRWQFADRFGVIGSGLAHTGKWLNGSELDDRGETFGLRAQISPYIGPYRHIVFGPTVTLGKNWYSIDSDNRSVTAKSDSAWVSGWGLQGGVFLGHTESLQVLAGVLFSGQRIKGPAPIPVSRDSMEAYLSVSFAL